MSRTGTIYGINGPVIYLKGDPGFKISEMVYVGPEHLVGEVIGLKKGMTTVQVFEETTGLKPGETVTGTGDAISVLLGPGIIHNIFDGIQRPLEEIAKSLDLRREDVVLALESIVEPVSLYEPVFSDGGDTIYVMDQVGDKNDDKNWLDEIALKEAMNDLSDREKRIMGMRFFQGKTHMEVAAEIGISQAQVSRLEKCALDKIKKDL